MKGKTKSKVLVNKQKEICAKKNDDSVLTVH